MISKMSYNFESPWLWLYIALGDKRTNALYEKASPAMTHSSSCLFNKYLLVISHESLIVWGTDATDALGIELAGSISEFSKRFRHIKNRNETKNLKYYNI